MTASTDQPILVVAVAYHGEDEALAMNTQVASRGTAGVELIVVDNSPTRSARLADAQSRRTRYLHFPDNPGFCGGARRALSILVGEQGAPLPYRAVVLANTDLTTDWDHVVASVTDAADAFGNHAWILAPNITEAGRKFRANPAGFEPTEVRRRQRVLRSSRLAFSAYWWLSQQKRARTHNPHADNERWSPMYRAYGAFMIFGAGYFTRGGVFHDAPLFNEEEAFARIARHIDVPILYEPELTVEHQAGLSYKHQADVYKRRYLWHRQAEQFYSGWRPEHVVGTMSTWFADPPATEQNRLPR